MRNENNRMTREREKKPIHTFFPKFTEPLQNIERLRGILRHLHNKTVCIFLFWLMVFALFSFFYSSTEYSTNTICEFISPQPFACEFWRGFFFVLQTVSFRLKQTSEKLRGERVNCKCLGPLQNQNTATGPEKNVDYDEKTKKR